MTKTTTIFKPEVLKTFDFPIKREEISNSRGFDTGYDNIYNQKTGRPLGVVSREYNLVTHQKAIFTVLDSLKEAGLPGIKPVHIRMAGHGAKMYAEFQFNQKGVSLGHAIENPKVGDIIAPGFKVYNSYDRTLKYGLSASLLRLVCTNGVAVSERLFSTFQRHSKNLEIGNVIERFIEGFGSFEKKIFPHIHSLSKQQVNSVVLQDELNQVPGWLQDETLDYLDKYKFIKFNDVEGDTEVEMVKKMSSWDLLNSFTYVLSHSENVSEENRDSLSGEISKRFGL